MLQKFMYGSARNDQQTLEDLRQNNTFGNQRIPNAINVYDQRECSVCLGEFYDQRNEIILKAAVFNCNHIFCYKCVSDFITRHNLNKVKCPNCRLYVTLIIPAINTNLTPEEETYILRMKDYNLRHSENSTIWSAIRDRNFLMRFFGMYMFSLDGIIQFCVY